MPETARLYWRRRSYEPIKFALYVRDQEIPFAVGFVCLNTDFIIIILPY